MNATKLKANEKFQIVQNQSSSIRKIVVLPVN